MLSAKGKSMLESSTSPVSRQREIQASLSSLQMVSATLRIASETIPRFSFCHTGFITDFKGHMHSDTPGLLCLVTQSSRFFNADSFDPLIHWMTVAGGYPREM